MESPKHMIWELIKEHNFGEDAQERLSVWQLLRMGCLNPTQSEPNQFRNIYSLQMKQELWGPLKLITFHGFASVVISKN